VNRPFVIGGSLIVVLTAIMSLKCWREESMAKSVKTLRSDAEKCIAADDYEGAFAACRELDTKKPDGRKAACAIRGECFDRLERLPEAFVQYQAAGDLGDNVAASSAADVLKRMQKGGK